MNSPTQTKTQSGPGPLTEGERNAGQTESVPKEVADVYVDSSKHNFSEAIAKANAMFFEAVQSFAQLNVEGSSSNEKLEAVHAALDDFCVYFNCGFSLDTFRSSSITDLDSDNIQSKSIQSEDLLRCYFCPRCFKFEQENKSMSTDLRSLLHEIDLQRQSELQTGAMTEVLAATVQLVCAEVTRMEQDLGAAVNPLGDQEHIPSPRLASRTDALKVGHGDVNEGPPESWTVKSRPKAAERLFTMTVQFARIASRLRALRPVCAGLESPCGGVCDQRKGANNFGEGEAFGDVAAEPPPQAGESFEVDVPETTNTARMDRWRDGACGEQLEATMLRADTEWLERNAQVLAEQVRSLSLDLAAAATTISALEASLGRARAVAASAARCAAGLAEEAFAARRAAEEAHAAVAASAAALQTDPSSAVDRRRILPPPSPCQSPLTAALSVSERGCLPWLRLPLAAGPAPLSRLGDAAGPAGGDAAGGVNGGGGGAAARAGYLRAAERGLRRRIRELQTAGAEEDGDGGGEGGRAAAAGLEQALSELRAAGPGAADVPATEFVRLLAAADAAAHRAARKRDVYLARRDAGASAGELRALAGLGLEAFGSRDADEPWRTLTGSGPLPWGRLLDADPCLAEVTVPPVRAGWRRRLVWSAVVACRSVQAVRIPGRAGPVLVPDFRGPRLDLSGGGAAGGLEADGAAGLVEAAAWAESVELRGSGLGAAGGRAVAAAVGPGHRLATIGEGVRVGAARRGAARVDVRGCEMEAVERGMLAGLLLRAAGAGAQTVALDMGACGLAEDAAGDVAGALAALTALTQLDLGGNGLGARGVAALRPALRGLTALTELRLEDNGLGPDGGREAARSAAGLRALETLDMSRNGLGPEGGAAVADAAAGLTRLRTLWLAGNALGAAAAARLREIARAAPALRDLVLDGDGGAAPAPAPAPARRELGAGAEGASRTWRRDSPREGTC